jgi:hypothetical protein
LNEGDAMNLDIRIPIGLMFAVLGAMLAIFGIVAKNVNYEQSLGININLWWGVLLFAFGAVMWMLGRRGTSSVREADDTPEGRKMEEREKQLGLESKPKRRGH